MIPLLPLTKDLKTKTVLLIWHSSYYINKALMNTLHDAERDVLRV